jgi:BolA family transcriptional regulator, general stress-responsive regulator
MDGLARQTAIREALETALQPQSLELEDESHLHRGHAGAQSGRGHFRLRIVASAFDGLSAIARHRLVYGALGQLMQTDIHALSIEAYSPHELAS